MGDDPDLGSVLEDRTTGDYITGHCLALQPGPGGEIHQAEQDPSKTEHHGRVLDREPEPNRLEECH